MVCVESTAVGITAVSIPIADSTGKATVNEHFPTQDISCIVTIFFMKVLLVYKSHYRRCWKIENYQIDRKSYNQIYDLTFHACMLFTVLVRRHVIFF